MAASNGHERRNKTGYVWHERYMWHHAGKYMFNEWIQPVRHFESPESKRRFHNLVELTGLLDKMVRIPARHATEEELTRFHTPGYVQRVKEMSAVNGGEAGDCATFSKGGYEIATLSAGGVIEAVTSVMKGEVDNAYALVRPPGHHAESDRGMGFCLFGNVALAALHAKAVFGLKRIAIVDYDVHHGNGTQQAFYRDNEVLFISVHQDRNYPADIGLVHEVGEGPGENFNINIPLPPGCGGGAYQAAFEQVVVPALDAYKPELILVSSGFDAGFLDPLGTMMLSSEHFRGLARTLIDAAGRHCGGKIVFAHEGGYSDVYVPFCGLAVVEELTGIKTECVDILLDDVNHWGYHELQPHQQDVITKSAAVVEKMKQRLSGKA